MGRLEVQAAMMPMMPLQKARSSNQRMSLTDICDAQLQGNCNVFDDSGRADQHAVINKRFCIDFLVSKPVLVSDSVRVVTAA